MARFTKAQLTKMGLRHRDVPIPDTDGTVEIRELNAKEAREVTKNMAAAQKSGNEDELLAALAAYVKYAVLDENGKSMFEGDEPATIVNSLSGLKTLQHLATEIAEFSGLSQEAAKDAQKKDGTT
jgi:hypothetical protein